MTREFIKKVEREGIVDTKKYRYVFSGLGAAVALIERIEIKKLDTISAYNGHGWKIVWIEVMEEH